MPEDSEKDLVAALFDLLELYPPLLTEPPFIVSDPRSPFTPVPKIPSSLDRRMDSFLRCDLRRTLRLIRRTCHIPDPEHKGRDRLHFPSSFMNKQDSARTWHLRSLEEQTECLLPFILELMDVDRNVLLKHGQLTSANLLKHARWQIIVLVARHALKFLNKDAVKSMSTQERNGIMAFVIYAIGVLGSRLGRVARRNDRVETQATIEHGLLDLLRSFLESVLEALRVSSSSDKIFTNSLIQQVILPLLNGPLRQYPPLIESMYASIKGAFDMTQAPISELVTGATEFFHVLKKKKVSIFDIPDDGLVLPYSGIKQRDNKAIFRLLLRLNPPRENPSFYAHSIYETLSEEQREEIWTHFDDLDFFSAQLFGVGKRLEVYADLLEKFPRSPHARLHIVQALLDHPNVTDEISAVLYPLLDISDLASRGMLQKNTYKRLFTDRYVAYNHLLTATWASGSIKEHILTLRFFIPRTKNEILPDAQTIPNLLNEHPVTELLHFLDNATEEEAKQLADLYLGWEKQNNEAISLVRLLGAF
jgi:hypothetical protein